LKIELSAKAMKKEVIQQLKKQLEDKKAKIEAELNSIAQKDPKFKGDYDTRYPDFGTAQSTDESALEVSAYESTLPIEYALEIRLQEINKALDKIKKGTYGKCEKCGQPIDEKRLMAMPEAETCAQCQTKK
jgi:DnaK suppressor protein